MVVLLVGEGRGGCWEGRVEGRLLVGEGRLLGGERLHGEELHCLYSSPSAVK